MYWNLLIVYCGRKVKFTFLSEEDLSVGEFQEIEIDFNPDVDICKIMSTGKKYHIQIVAKETTLNNLIVVTWDCENNIEASMFQYHYKDKEMRPENYIVRGMNQKFNYFINEYQVFDLEYNLPLQTCTNNTLRSDGSQGDLFSRRLIYWDGTRTLSIDKPNIINFPCNRIDILFWKDISKFDDDVVLIEENTTLAQFNTVYEG